MCVDHCQNAFKSGIPGRLWRLDPHLKLVDDNAIYEAFWYRRLYKRRRSLTERYTGIHWWGLAIWAVVVLLILLALHVFGGIVGLFAPLVPIFVFIYRVCTKRRRLHDSELPGRALNCFTPHGYHPGIIRDLWLAGATGRSILEAVYLEKREEKPGAFYLKVPLLFLLILLVYTGILLISADGWLAFTRPHHWVGVLLAGWFSWEVVQMEWVLRMYRIARGVLTDIINIWNGEFGLEVTLERVFIVPVIWVAIVFSLSSGFMGAWIILLHLDFFRTWMVPWFVCLNVALLPLGCIVLRRKLALRFSAELNRVFGRADGAFLRFIEREFSSRGEW